MGILYVNLYSRNQILSETVEKEENWDTVKHLFVRPYFIYTGLYFCKLSYLFL